MTNPAGTPADDTKYDRQLVVALLDGADDHPFMEQAVALDAKHRDPPLPSEWVSLRLGLSSADAAGVRALQDAIAGRRQVQSPVTRRSRLYVVGRSDANALTLGGWSSSGVAGLLVLGGLRELALLSIVGDGAGLDPQHDQAGQTDADAVSFASELHRLLRVVHGVETFVNARVGAVRVRADGRKLTAMQIDEQPARHKAAQSKIGIRWVGDEQHREWSY